MRNNRLYLFAAVICLCAMTAWTQAPPGPELAKMSNLAFGWVSMSGVDPTLEMLTSFAPATMALRDAGYRTGGEAVAGRFTFGDLSVDSTFQSAMTSLGPGVLRLCHYAYSSNTAAIYGIPGMLGQTEGDAVEISYAQHVGKATLGFSLIPKDSSSVTLSNQGMTLVESESTTDYGLRGGAILRLNDHVRLGYEYSYQEDSGKTSLSPLLTGAPVWLDSEGDFITRCSTLGLSGRIGPKTMAYASYQEILATGSTLDRRLAKQRWAGVQHNFTDNFALRANYLEGGQNYSLQYKSPYGLVNLAYTHKALMNARDILGTGDAAFASLALAF